MEKINNQFNKEKESRRKFIKNIINAGIIGGASYYLVKKTPEQIKKIKEALEKEEKEFNNFINSIENLSIEIEKETTEYEKIHQNLIEKIENLISKENEIDIFDKQEYFQELFSYNDKINNELNRIDLRKKRIDSIFKSIKKTVKLKDFKKYKDIEKIINNLLKSKTKLLEMEKKYSETQNQILDLIEKVHKQIKPDKKFA